MGASPHRAEAAMKMFDDVGAMAHVMGQTLQRVQNQLAILAEATKGVPRWGPDQEPLMKALLSELEIRGVYDLEGLEVRHQFGGFPCRMDRSLGVLLAGARLMPTMTELRASAEALRTSPDLAAAVRGLQGGLARQLDYASVWRGAAAAERKRFQAEQ